MKSFSKTIPATPVISGVGMLVWEMNPVTRLSLRNHRESTGGRDEIAMG
jgi:hypothetical protein